MRRFELSQGTSNKFWEVSVEEAQLVVRFGRIGSAGQTKKKAFASPAEAEREATKLIAEKTSKGYAEAGPPHPTPEEATQPAVGGTAIRAVLRNREGEERPAVLAGDQVILGEGDQIQVQKLESEAAAREHFERVVFLQSKRGWTVARTEAIALADALPPPELEALNEFEGEVNVSNGRLQITCKGDEAVPLKVCQGLVKRVAQSRARTVQLICDPGSPGANWAEAIAPVRLTNVQAFIFDTYFQTQVRQQDNSIGDLATTLGACPSLARLYATGDLSLSRVRHDNLQELYLNGAKPLPAGLVQTLGRCDMPALRRLSLSLSAEGEAGPDQMLLEVLPKLGWPSLRDVHLSDIGDIPGFLRQLLRRGIPTGWKTVTLAGTWDGSCSILDLAPMLKDQAAAYRTLEVLAVPFDEEEAAGLPPSVKDSADWKGMFLPGAYDGW